MAAHLSQILDALTSFAFYYPLFMAYLWMIGAIYYYFHWERNTGQRVDEPPVLPEYPGVSFLVPCHNEGEDIEETIEHLLQQKYPEFEIIAINDGSKDNTGAILDRLAEKHPKLRIIHLATNQGKAMALRTGAIASKYEFLVCIDGDALLDEHATPWLIQHFVYGPRVGAVTGNPRVRTRSTLLGKIQVGEFSAIVGMIKRAQRIYGRIFTVSGVVSAFRKSALHRIGYWSLDTVTDDIDISWNLQLNRWDIRFEPNALCWILMPETMRGLSRQRLRWAQGGMEAFLRYLPNAFSWRSRRMWMVYLEFITSVVWAYLMITILTIWVAGLFIELPPELQRFANVKPNWNGVVLGITCMLQFAVALMIDRRFERGIGKIYYWMIWYPVMYWVLNVFTCALAAPRAVLRRLGHNTRGTWVSPDRGIR
ncbi:MAG: poly-beta-1,6 N-acetyl-D-glucosamine synthase [Chromatiales bacterium]|jgi:biofilm PGA synthesis N-glycosyltransferase PgaC|nr:poly-beta-1,6 N-acetyl-D-glucosamine synthase [Chromatiales bacterium]